MWEILIESCADMFGVSAHSRGGRLVVFCAAIFALGVVLLVRWGPGSLVVPVGLLLLSVLATRQVSAARNELWRAACKPLDDPDQLPERVDGQILAPSADALLRLAGAVDLVRRGRYADANDLVPQIQRDLLRPEEHQLLDAARAMISIGLGSTGLAAKQAVVALPTGSDDLDTNLGRTLIADAWNDPARLAAIHAAWSRAGVQHGPLARLASLARLRIDERALDAVDPPSARDLADEARAIGDDTLAAELDAKGRPNAYR